MSLSRHRKLTQISKSQFPQPSASLFGDAVRAYSSVDATTAASDDASHINPALDGFRKGAIQPRVVEFQLTVDQAKASFKQWHAQRWLAPTRLLDKPDSSIRAVLLPFWLFEVSVHVQHSANLGFAISGHADGALHWSESKQYSKYREYPWNLKCMQIYASYKWRRDFVKGIKTSGCLTRTRPLKEAEAILCSAQAGRGHDRQVDVDVPNMRQSVAWELALRAIRIKETAKAAAALKAASGADAVKDIQLNITTTRRRARVLYLPAFIVDYTFGEYLTSAGERKPHKYMAVISGMGDGKVMSERHFDPRKAQVLAGTAVGGATLAVGALASMATGGFPPSMLSLMCMDNAFWLLIACPTAGLAAKLAPYALQRQIEEVRLAEDEADLDKIQKSGLGPMDIGDNESLWTISHRDWRRWEESDLYRWDARMRQEWASSILRSTHMRALQRRRFIARHASQQERQQAEADRETRRRERFGDTSSHHQRMGGGDTSYGGRKVSQWDCLGYYKLLGLDESSGDLSSTGAKVTELDIKRAFRKAAMTWHPDRRDSLRDADRDSAHQRFQELSKAYEVLRDPDTRRQYDAGAVTT